MTWRSGVRRQSLKWSNLFLLWSSCCPQKRDSMTLHQNILNSLCHHPHSIIYCPICSLWLFNIIQISILCLPKWFLISTIFNQMWEMPFFILVASLLESSGSYKISLSQASLKRSPHHHHLFQKQSTLLVKTVEALTLFLMIFIIIYWY